MHVCMMHISMILDLDSEACIYIYIYIYIYTIVHVSMMRSFSVTDERTNKAILGVGYERIKF